MTLRHQSASGNPQDQQQQQQARPTLKHHGAAQLHRFDPIVPQRDDPSIVPIVDAYCEYFNHVRFRNKWAAPAFSKAFVSAPFRDSAECVFLMRKFLDEVARKSAGQTLRMLDGNAQTFLHTDAAKESLAQGRRPFATALVHATMQDAMGYVEGLDQPTVQLLADKYHSQLPRFDSRQDSHRRSPFGAPGRNAGGTGGSTGGGFAREARGSAGANPFKSRAKHASRTSLSALAASVKGQQAEPKRRLQVHNSYYADDTTNTAGKPYFPSERF